MVLKYGISKPFQMLELLDFLSVFSMQTFIFIANHYISYYLLLFNNKSKKCRVTSQTVTIQKSIDVLKKKKLFSIVLEMFFDDIDGFVGLLTIVSVQCRLT